MLYYIILYYIILYEPRGLLLQGAMGPRVGIRCYCIMRTVLYYTTLVVLCYIMS